MVTARAHPTQWPLYALTGLLLAAGLARAGRFRLARILVEGASMLPGYRPGDRLLVLRPYPVRPGQVVALPDPRLPDRLLVKRVHRVDGRWVHLRGDNPSASTDSRHFGAVERRRLLGRVVYRYWPADRAGWCR